MGLVDQEELSPLPQTGPIDGILFIRSSRVFEGEDPGPEEIARLQRTIGVLEKVDPRKRMILDADAVSSSRTPLVLYANPEFDVTSHVTKIFRRFLEFEDSIKRIEDRQDKSQK